MLKKLLVPLLVLSLLGAIAVVGVAQQKVTIATLWSGEELEDFEQALVPFEQATGIDVVVESVGRDLPAVLVIRVAAGNPPDVVVMPNPGQMREFAKSGDLVPIDSFMDMEKLRANYGATLDDASYGGQVYGFFFKMAVKSLVWYNPSKLYATGLGIPDSWNELLYVTDKLAATGVTPWAVGLECGAASGWAGTDWIEDIMLRTAGPELYDKWVNHEIPWTHPAVRNAFEMFGQIVRGGASDWPVVYGGTTGVVSINFGDSPAVLFTDPPGAYFHRQASFITGFFPEGVTPTEDYDFFPFPAIDTQFGIPVLTAGDIIATFSDRAEVKQLLDYLASVEPQAIMAAVSGGYLSANKSLSLDVYPDELTRKMAQTLTEAKVARYDGSDLMPAAVGSGTFWTGVLDYVTGIPLDTVLGAIEASAIDAYGE